MFKKGCQIELCLFDDRKWYSVFSVFKPVSLGIRYDEEYFIIFKGDHLFKIKESRVIKKIMHREVKEINCRAYYVGKAWLDNCLLNPPDCKDKKAFASMYIGIINKSYEREV